MRASAEDRGYASAVAAFSAIAYGALIVASFGMLSLFTDRDVISNPDVGPVAGPIMSVVAILVVLGCLLRIGWSVPFSEHRVKFGRSLLIGLLAYLGFVISGGVAVAVGAGRAVGIVDFMASQVLSPFAALVGVLAVIVAALYSAVLRSRGRGPHRPEWPWEHEDGL